MTQNQMNHIITTKLTSLFTVKLVKLVTSKPQLADLYTNGDIYIGNTKVCEYRENKEVKVKFIDNAKEEMFNDIVKQNDIFGLFNQFPEYHSAEDNNYLISMIVHNKADLNEFDKKIKFAQKKAICFGYINADTFSILKYNISLEEINKSGRIATIQARLDEIRAKLTVGMVILNTNLKEVGLV